MKKRLLTVIVSVLLVLCLSTTAFANYGNSAYNYNYSSYVGEDYYNHNFSGYGTSYYLSPWADYLKEAYKPKLYENFQRPVTRGEFSLVFLRAIQKSLDRQKYSKLTAGYIRAPFTDYNTVNPTAQGEVNVLYSNHILKGFPDNTMRFSQVVVRSEAAAFYSRFNQIYFNMGPGYNQWDYNGYGSYYNNNYNNYYNSYRFDDIDNHWAAQEIIMATSTGVFNGVGYIHGVGNNCFDPDGLLTIEQLWKMLDSCVGYQGLRRSDVAYAMEQTFKVKFDNKIDENYGVSSGTKITRLSVDTSTVSISEGQTKKIKISIYPTKAAYQKLQWSFENPSDYNYVAIDEAWNSSSGTAYVNVYGKKAKNSYITLIGKAMDGSGAYVRVKVKVTDDYDYDYDYDYEDGYITSIVPSQDTIYLEVGESVEVNARIKPSNADYKKLSWKSANENIAYITGVYTSGNYSYATINANNPGAVQVNIEAMDGSDEEEIITVIVNDDEPEKSVITSATASPSYVDMNVGETQNITILTYPTSADDRDMRWISENQNIARVEKISDSKIRIIAVGAGRTSVRGIVTATGREACVIPITIAEKATILDREAPIVEVLTDMSNLKKGDSGYFDITAYDDNLSSLKVYKSSILGITQIGIEITNIETIADNVVRVYWVAKETCSGEFCVAAGVAVDKSGNKSEESLGVYVCVNPID